MSKLATLKLIQAKRPSQLAPVIVRRHKLSKKIWEQVQLVKATLEGNTYHTTRYRTVVDPSTGLNKSIEMPKRVKQWWWTADTGKVCLTIRYGAKQINLNKDKNAVEVTGLDDLIPVLEQIKLAVEAGELDTQIEQASGALRAGFKR